MSDCFAGFVYERFEPEVGLLEFAESVSEDDDLEAVAFLAYAQMMDERKRIEVEMCLIKAGEKVILPRSVDGHSSKLVYAGGTPVFKGLTVDGNLQAMLPKNCVVRVEFKGVKTSRKRRVKYYKTI